MTKNDSPRLAALKSMLECPVRRGLLKRLGDDGLQVVFQFIKAHDNDSYAEFSHRINRMYLDCPARPKNWESITNVLTEANGALYERKKGRK